MSEIVLASGSPRRKELLEKAELKFSVLAAGGEEKTVKKRPEDVVEELSVMKARGTARLLEEDGRAGEGLLVIAADTVVAFQGEILGKPASKEDAVKTLLRLQDQTHQVYTGVTLQKRVGEEWITRTFYECTDVTFYPVTEEEIRRYVETGEPMDKAGSYGIQGAWFVHVKGICGDYNNVVGLPVARLLREIGTLEDKREESHD